MSAEPTITVILNVFRRSKSLEQQLAAIRAQSVPVDKILVWENGVESVPEALREGLIISRANENLGVWARFAYALNADTDFILMLDDDTIRGWRKLFEQRGIEVGVRIELAGHAVEQTRYVLLHQVGAAGFGVALFGHGAVAAPVRGKAVRRHVTRVALGAQRRAQAPHAQLQHRQAAEQQHAILGTAEQYLIRLEQL